MYSSEGERVQLIQNISTSEAKGAVEKWLVQVEDLMLRSVRDVVARSRLVRSLFPLANMYSSSNTGFLEWILILGMTKGRLSFDLQAHIFHHAGLDFIYCSFAASHVPERNLWMWMCSCFTVLMNFWTNFTWEHRQTVCKHPSSHPSVGILVAHLLKYNSGCACIALDYLTTKLNVVLTGLRWDFSKPVGEGLAGAGGALHLSDILDVGGSWSHPGGA